MGRRIEASGPSWLVRARLGLQRVFEHYGKLVRLHRRSYRRRDRAHVSGAAPPLERKPAEREHSEQAAEQRQSHARGGRAGLEPCGDEGDDEAHDRRCEPDGKEEPGEPRHLKAPVEDGLAVALAKPADESRPEQGAVACLVAVIEHHALASSPTVEPRRVPRPTGDDGLDPRTGVGGRTAALEGRRFHRSSPRSTVTACPPIITRSPASLTRTTPPLGEAW